MGAAIIAAALGGAYRSGPWSSCHCPVHGSRGAPLALKDSDRGLIVKCFAGYCGDDIYHLGDFDPSGVNAGQKIEETLREMAPDAEIHFWRIAVTPEQITSWRLPTRPTKASDSRAKGVGDIKGATGSENL